MKRKFRLQLFATDVSIIDRTGADSLIPEEKAKEIIQGVVTQSAVLYRGNKMANMSSKTHKMPVLDMLPIAYFVDGDTGQKKTTKQAWVLELFHIGELEGYSGQQTNISNFYAQRRDIPAN